MKPVTWVCVLVVITSVGTAFGGVVEEMTALRNNFPKPEHLSQRNGIVALVTGGEAYVIVRIAAVAKRIKLRNTQDMIVLMSYLRDSDVRIRYLAAYILAQTLDVFVNRTPPQEVVKELDSQKHKEMVATFARKIAEQSPAGDRLKAAPEE